MDNYSQILWQAYEKNLLPLGGKKVPTPYRINIPYQFDRRKYGKSDPAKLVTETKQIAREQNFDLQSTSVEEIRKFMEENSLGIDCSGFIYHLTDFLLKKINKHGMLSAGFPKASSTNVKILTSGEFSIPLNNLTETKPGDLVRLNSPKDHCIIILENQAGIVTYAHSSSMTNPTGVHTGQIINSQFPEDLNVFSYKKQAGDGIRRLKILV